MTIRIIGTIAAFSCFGLGIATGDWFAAMGWLTAGLLQLAECIRETHANGNGAVGGIPDRG